MGTGVHATGDYPFKSLFLKNTLFTRKNTLLFRSMRKCAKTGQSLACPGLLHSPEGPYRPENNGAPSGPKI